MVETVAARVVSTVMYRAECYPCGLVDGHWVSPWFTFESDAERVKELHDEAMGHG